MTKFKLPKAAIMENGRIVNLMAKVNFFLQTALIIKEHFCWDMPMDKAGIFLIMDAFIKEILKIMKLTEKGPFMIRFKAMNIMDIGLTTCLQEKVNKSLPMDHITKDSL
jgi:hypothetical protein